MIKKIYFVGIVIITIITIIFYLRQEKDHQIELEKIDAIEKEWEDRRRQKEYLRTLTKPCPITGLTTPKTCYLGSDRTCSWNDAIDRCDVKS